jgi:hypothetical protein
VNKALEYALREADAYQLPLYILFICEQKVITEQDLQRLWTTDRGACAVFDYVIASPHKKSNIGFLYTITANTAHSIAEIATNKKVHHVIIGQRRPSTLLQTGRHLIRLLRGTTAREVSRYLPPSIDLVVIY